MSKFEYHVRGNLDHDQVKYAPGDTVVMSEGEAEPLIAIGVLFGKPLREVEDESEASEQQRDGTAAKPKSGKAPKDAADDQGAGA